MLARIEELAAVDADLLNTVRLLVESPAQVSAEEIVRRIGELLSTPPVG